MADDVEEELLFCDTFSHENKEVRNEFLTKQPQIEVRCYQKMWNELLWETASDKKVAYRVFIYLHVYKTITFHAFASEFDRQAILKDVTTVQ